MNQKNANSESAVLLEVYKPLPDCFGVKIMGIFFFNDIIENKAVLKKADYLK